MLRLLDRIESYTHHDQQDPCLRKKRLDVEEAEDPERNQSNERQIDRSRKRDAGQHPIDVFGRRAPGFTPGMKAPLLLEVLGQIDGVENDGRVKVGEKDDQKTVSDVINGSGLKDVCDNIEEPPVCPMSCAIVPGTTMKD